MLRACLPDKCITRVGGRCDSKFPRICLLTFSLSLFLSFSPSVARLLLLLPSAQLREGRRISPHSAASLARSFPPLPPRTNVGRCARGRLNFWGELFQCLASLLFCLFPQKVVRFRVVKMPSNSHNTTEFSRELNLFSISRRGGSACCQNRTLIR